MSQRVICIRQNNSADGCQGISHLGLRGDEMITRLEAWQRVKRDEHALYVYHQGERHFLEAVTRDGTRYVRTKTDSPNVNLLDLPDCDNR